MGEGRGREGHFQLGRRIGEAGQGGREVSHTILYGRREAGTIGLSGRGGRLGSLPH